MSLSKAMGAIAPFGEKGDRSFWVNRRSLASWGNKRSLLFGETGDRSLLVGAIPPWLPDFLGKQAIAPSGEKGDRSFWEKGERAFLGKQAIAPFAKQAIAPFWGNRRSLCVREIGDRSLLGETPVGKKVVAGNSGEGGMRIIANF